MTVHPSPDGADRFAEEQAAVTPTPHEVDQWVQELVHLTQKEGPTAESDGGGIAELGSPPLKRSRVAQADDDSVVTALMAENVPSALDRDAYQRILADELGRLRRRRGWTRKYLLSRMKVDLSLRTLATYELGTRQMSVLRLVELCYAMNELPQNLLARVHRRLTPEGVVADLSQIAELNAPHLTPLRMWARQQLSHQPDDTSFRFDLVALRRMAELCDVPLPDLIRHLNGIGLAQST